MLFGEKKCNKIERANIRLGFGKKNAELHFPKYDIF